MKKNKTYYLRLPVDLRLEFFDLKQKYGYDSDITAFRYFLDIIKKNKNQKELISNLKIQNKILKKNTSIK